MADVYTQLSIDKQVLFERFGGMEALANKYLFSFPDDKNFALLRDAVQKGDLASAENAAHSLKGICANLELTAFSDICDRIVRLIRAQRTDKAYSQEDLTGALDALMRELSDAYKKITQILGAV